MRYLTSAVVVIAAGIACSRGPERNVAATMTGPTAISLAGPDSPAGGVSGSLVIHAFPGRQDLLTFRLELEARYQHGLFRTPIATYVDQEGEVVWMLEYLRYRVHGCDHATAIARVRTQVANGPAGPICAEPPDGLVAFPSRADVLDFRRVLEEIYQQMGRGLTLSYADLEGVAIWTAEYLRYRLNSCEHPAASEKTLTQVAGNPPPDTCFVPCSYLITPGNIHYSASAATGRVEIRPNRAGCAWTAASDASWLAFPSDYTSGNSFASIPYTVEQNNGADRLGRIRFAFPTGGSSMIVSQSGTPFVAGFTLVDTFRGPSGTTECQFRSANTPCTLTAFANLPGNTYTYAWSVSYFYGTLKQGTQTGASAIYAFADQCGGTESTPEGTFKEMVVILTISDELGNSITIRSGEGNSPALGVRLYTC
jgi:hypothetical protein